MLPVMAEKKIVTCDNCGATPAEPWVIGRLGRQPTKVDLCEDCAAKMEELRKKGTAVKSSDRRPYMSVKDLRVDKVKTEPR